MGESKSHNSCEEQLASVNVLHSNDGTAWRPESRPCPVCNSQERKRLGVRGGRSHRDGKGIEAQIVQCTACELIYAAPTLIPTTNPYALETSDTYFSLHDGPQKVSSGGGLVSIAERLLGYRGRLLELGCGRGELLVGAAERGWEVEGVEMTQGFADVARSAGLSVECCSIQESQLLGQEARYDVVLLAAVLEHLYDPRETLQKVNRVLRPGGLLFLDVPNECSLTMRMGNWYMRARGRNWVINLSPTFSPFHVVGFSPASLTAVLRMTGFRVHTMDVCQWSNNLPEGKNLIGKIERLGLSLVQAVGSRIGMGDGITCWAVRE